MDSSNAHIRRIRPNQFFDTNGDVIYTLFYFNHVANVHLFFLSFVGFFALFNYAYIIPYLFQKINRELSTNYLQKYYIKCKCSTWNNQQIKKMFHVEQPTNQENVPRGTIKKRESPQEAKDNKQQERSGKNQVANLE